MESLRGQLLVAGPALVDPNFWRTVVLIGEHNEEGALGVVLNRPAPVTVGEAAPALANLVEDGEPVFLGGPVQPESAVVLADVEHPDFAGLIVFGSIGFLMGEVDPHAVDGIRRARVFAGYAGWGAGQLEAEMVDGSWIAEPALAEDVFADQPDRLWSSVLLRKGGEYAILSTMPPDPSLN
ncbi:MAG: YqgE/AlgH family protein [Actinomycetota bacterium]|jgi:putative transcriptional regulator